MSSDLRVRYGILDTMSSKKLNTRSRILDATWKLMISKKGTGVKMADIAKASGISRQAVYLHFASRPELIVAAVQYADDELGIGDRYAAVLESKSGVERLHTFIDFWGNYIPEIYGIAKALLASRDTDEAAAAAWNDRMEAVRKECRDLIKVLSKKGVLSDGWTISEAADVLSTMLSIQGWERLTIERGWTVKKYVANMQKAVERAFVKSV